MFSLVKFYVVLLLYMLLPLYNEINIFQIGELKHFAPISAYPVADDIWPVYVHNVHK